jgi:hypothetical protein
MRKLMRLFLDESGNSGSQVYDQAQPVFALAGVWLNTENEAHFTQRLTTVCHRGNRSISHWIVLAVDSLVRPTPASISGFERRAAGIRSFLIPAANEHFNDSYRALYLLD